MISNVWDLYETINSSLNQDFFNENINCDDNNDKHDDNNDDKHDDNKHSNKIINENEVIGFICQNKDNIYDEFITEIVNKLKKDENDLDINDPNSHKLINDYVRNSHNAKALTDIYLKYEV